LAQVTSVLHFNRCWPSIAMAPHGVKRAAKVDPVAPKRKKTNADPVAPKCKEVVSAINSADALPGSCKEMLVNMVQSSLTVFAAERHAYQNQAVGMLRETLTAVQVQLQNAVSEAQAKVDSSDREKASRAAALERSQANLATAEKNASTGKDALENDKNALLTAKANFSAGQAAIDVAEAEVVAKTDQRLKLESAMKDAWEPLKTAKASGHEGNRSLKLLEKVFTDVGLEAGLVDSLPESLRKSPEERGTFDGIVAKHVEAKTSQYLVQAEAAIREADQNKTNLGASKAAAEEKVAAAQEKVAEKAAGLHAADASLKDSKSALKVAQNAVDSFDREMANAGGSIDGAKAALTTFMDGALQSFTALKDLAPPPEPEPESIVASEPVEAVTAAPEVAA